jgi:hypothetical protein
MVWIVVILTVYLVCSRSLTLATNVDKSQSQLRCSSRYDACNARGNTSCTFWCFISSVCGIDMPRSKVKTCLRSIRSASLVACRQRSFNEDFWAITVRRAASKSASLYWSIPGKMKPGYCQVCFPFAGDDVGRVPTSHLQARPDPRNRPAQHHRVILRRHKPPTSPIGGGFVIECVDDQGRSANQAGGLNSFCQSMPYKSGANAKSAIAAVNGKLAQQNARNGIRWLAGLDVAGQNCRCHSSRGKTIEPNDLHVLMHHADGCEIFALIANGARREPITQS